MNFNIEKTIQKLIDFRAERDWTQFSSPRDFATGLSIEASELLELFLWKSSDEIHNAINNNPNFKERVAEELADVICYALLLNTAFNFDLEKIVLDKIEKNKKKYPVELVKGKRRNKSTGQIRIIT